MKRKHASSNQGVSVQGHTCRICNAIGDHLEDACPAKTLVHLPRTFRKEVHDKTVAAVRETFFLPPNFLAGEELYALLRERHDTPPALICIACTKLAHEAIWCSCCDVLACAACLGPATEPYVCCQCGCDAPDSFHVVGAVRALCSSWTQAMARAVDKATVCKGVVASNTPVAKNMARNANAKPSGTL